MDLDEWEFIPDDGFLEIHDDGGKKIFSRKYGKDSNSSVFNMNYFVCPSPRSQKFVDSSEESRVLPKQQLVPIPIQLDPQTVDDHEEVKEITKVPIEISLEVKAPNTGAVETDQDTVSQVFFKKMKENEFVDMKLDSPKSCSRGIMAQIDAGTFQFDQDKGEAIKGEAMESRNCSSKVRVEKEMVVTETKEEKVSWEEESNGGLNIWKWSLTGIGAVCSFGVAAAAATVCIIFLGSGQRNKHQQNNHQNLRFQIYSEDKRMKQVVHHATKFNEAISAARGVPLTRAHITFGGYYDGL